MLSKVAERIYWTARYLERVESTARLLSIYDKLLFDMPRQVNLGWYNLIVINSLEESFSERYSVRDERNVVKFLLGDDTNPSSVQSSLQAIRENVRTTRDVVPAEAWEMINELSFYVQENLSSGVNRSHRHEFLDHVINACLQISGLLYASMPRDEGWEMLQLGLHLERADMTTRNLDAGVAAILQVADDEFAVNSKQIILSNVLRSLNADQPYRRAMRNSVKEEPVVDFLMADPHFPRSVVFCLSEMIHASEALPGSERVIAATRKLHRDVMSSRDHGEYGEDFREELNELQILIQKLHFLIGRTWFLTDQQE